MHFVYINQLSSTSHLERWFTRGKKHKELNHIPDSLKNSRICFLNVHNVLQCNNVCGKRFHSSITLTLKKFLLIYKWAWGLYSLYLWPVSPVLDTVKKSVGLTSSNPCTSWTPQSNLHAVSLCKIKWSRFLWQLVDATTQKNQFCLTGFLFWSYCKFMQTSLPVVVRNRER